MSEIEKLIEKNVRYLWNGKGHNRSDLPEDVQKTLEQNIAFLRTLQPHDNAKLVEDLKHIKKIGEFSLHYDNSLKKIIDRLSQPRPFDVLEHLKNGGKITTEKMTAYLYLHGMDIMQSDNVQCTWFFDIDISSWQPYTEPQLEDGLYFVSSDQNPKRKFIALFERGQWLPYTGRGDEFEGQIITPVVCPSTNLPWRIEEPEDT